VGCQVFKSHAAASLFDHFRDCLGDLTLVKGLFSAIGDHPHGVRQSGIAENFSCSRSVSVDQHLITIRGFAQQPVC